MYYVELMSQIYERFPYGELEIHMLKEATFLNSENAKYVKNIDL